MTYPMHVEAELQPDLNRWLWLVKWVLLIPHYIVLVFLWIAFLAMSIAAFFAILSLPPLIFGLAGSIGFIASQYFAVETIADIKLQIAELAGRALTDESVKEVIVPTLNQVLSGGRPDVISIGFVLALWSGSRALNVFVDTITIMYGMGGKRGIVRTRALSFSLYCAALVIGVIVLPLVLAGPDAVEALLPHRVAFLNQLYWPVVTILSPRRRLPSGRRTVSRNPRSAATARSRSSWS